MAATLKTIVAIPTTWMLKARLGSNAMRHRWRQSSDSLDLPQARSQPSNLKHLELPVRLRDYLPCCLMCQSR
jgi:hypothetical protein